MCFVMTCVPSQPLGLSSCNARICAAALLHPRPAPDVHALETPWRRFVSIHASIPAVIAARKALTVPRAAVFLSIACAVVGQQVSAAVATCSTSQQTLHSPVATLGGQCVDFRGVVLSPACV